MNDVELVKMHAIEDHMWWFQGLRGFMFKILPLQNSKGFAIFDIGCGTGRWGQELSEKGYRVYGIDYAAKGIELARTRGLKNLAVADANRLPVKKQEFDLVTCVDVLEMDGIDPHAVVSNALRVLKPGAYALFVAPAHQWLMSEHDRAVTSVRRYSLKELIGIFPEDVQIVRATYLFLLVFPLTMIWKLLNGRKETTHADSDVDMPHQFVNELLNFICRVEAQLLQWFDFPIGSSALVLVRKP